MTKAERQKEWEVRVAAFRASGQSISAWCAAHIDNPSNLNRAPKIQQL